MQLPMLDQWLPTAKSLHKAAMLLGAIRLLVREPAANYLEMAMRIEPDGVSTDTLPQGGSVRLDFRRAEMVWHLPNGSTGAIALQGNSQLSLGETLLQALAAHGDPLNLTARDGSLVKGLVDALQARQVRLPLHDADLADEQPLALDQTVSAAYAEVLYRVFTATARFRARLQGAMTPIVVWPEHFDLGFLWFATESTDDAAPQMNFGFAPFSDGIDRPYLYAYAFPMPEGFTQLPLPSIAQWHTKGWNGALIPYDSLREANDPEAAVESVLTDIFATLAPTLRYQK